MAEKGVTDIDVIDVDLFKNEHRDPDYLKRAGLANVPALEMNCGTTITESLAICRYLESLYPTPNLFGRDAKEIAVIEMWTRRAEMLLATPLMMAVRHSHPALAALETQIPEVASANRAGADRALKVFDRRLEESAFIAGDRLTIADIVAFIGVDFARMVRFEPSTSFLHFRRWMGDMRSRSASSAGV
jgi:glutathione S-transferase